VVTGGGNEPLAMGDEERGLKMGKWPCFVHKQRTNNNFSTKLRFGSVQLLQPLSAAPGKPTFLSSVVARD
jgi:hypothetical protein